MCISAFNNLNTVYQRFSLRQLTCIVFDHFIQGGKVSPSPVIYLVQ